MASRSGTTSLVKREAGAHVAREALVVKVGAKSRTRSKPVIAVKGTGQAGGASTGTVSTSKTCLLQVPRTCHAAISRQQLARGHPNKIWVWSSTKQTESGSGAPQSKQSQRDWPSATAFQCVQLASEIRGPLRRCRRCASKHPWLNFPVLRRLQAHGASPASDARSRGSGKALALAKSSDIGAETQNRATGGVGPAASASTQLALCDPECVVPVRDFRS